MDIINMIDFNLLGNLAAFGQYFTMIAMIVPVILMAIPARIVTMPAVATVVVYEEEEATDLVAARSSIEDVRDARFEGGDVQWANTHKSVLIGWEARKARKELVEKAMVAIWYGIMIVKAAIDKAEARKVELEAERADILKAIELYNAGAKAASIARRKMAYDNSFVGLLKQAEAKGIYSYG